MRGTQFAELTAFVAVAEQRGFTKAASHLRAGRLSRVLSRVSTLPAEGYFLYYPSRRQTPAALKALVDFLRRAAAQPAGGGNEAL